MTQEKNQLVFTLSPLWFIEPYWPTTAIKLNVHTDKSFMQDRIFRSQAGTTTNANNLNYIPNIKYNKLYSLNVQLIPLTFTNTVS